MLGWRFPVHVFDLHTAFFQFHNILSPHNPNEVLGKPRKRLSDACRRYGIVGWENIDKEEIAKAIGEGRWREYGEAAVYGVLRRRVCDSCELLRAQLVGYGPYERRRPASGHALEEYSAKTVAGSRPAACRSTCRCGTWCRRTRRRSSPH